MNELHSSGGGPDENGPSVRGTGGGSPRIHEPEHLRPEERGPAGEHEPEEPAGGPEGATADPLPPVRTVTTWFLEQTAPEDLVDVRTSDTPSGLRIERAEVPEPAFSRFLYSEVGADVEWIDRLPWSRDQWDGFLRRPGVETWVAYERGTPAGFMELDGATEDTSGRSLRPGATVEVSYFGLLPRFRGRGIGRRLLAYGVARAWDMGERWEGREPTARVWLHTCSKDGPHALRNYQRRGFRIYAKEVTVEPLPPAESVAGAAGPAVEGLRGFRPPGPRPASG